MFYKKCNKTYYQIKKRPIPRTKQSQSQSHSHTQKTDFRSKLQDPSTNQIKVT